MKIIPLIALVASLSYFCVGCASVDVTKTAKGFHQPTNPNDVEILMTMPAKHFEELATISATGFNTGQTAKMHNALRAKAAPLGANAVIVTSSGILQQGGLGGGNKLWVNGVAVAWK
jgi:hypothetical protein